MPLIRVAFRGILLGGLLLLIVPGPCGLAQERAASDGATHGKKTLRAVRTELPVVVDGDLDEPAWQAAEVSSPAGRLWRSPWSPDRSLCLFSRTSTRSLPVPILEA